MDSGQSRKIEHKDRGKEEPDQGVMNEKRQDQCQSGGNDRCSLRGRFTVVVALRHQQGDDLARCVRFGLADRRPYGRLLI